jgi:hypothetical protein
MIRIELICANPMNPLYLFRDEVTRSVPAGSFRILLLRISHQFISHHHTFVTRRCSRWEASFLIFRIFEIYVLPCRQVSYFVFSKFSSRGVARDGKQASSYFAFRIFEIFVFRISFIVIRIPRSSASSEKESHP